MAIFFSEIHTESVFVSLDKSVLLHSRCLMLILVCRKIFCAFYLILHETFSSSCSFPYMQEFNPLYPDVVRYDKKHFCNLDWFEQPFIFVSSKVPLAKLYDVIMFLQNSFQKCRSSRLQCSLEAVTQSCSKKGIVRNFAKFTGKHLC